MLTLDSEQVSLIFDDYINGMPAGMLEKIRNDCLQDLASKKKGYKDRGYSVQLEKNMVYLAESTAFFYFYIALYLHSGEPRLFPADVANYVNDVRKSIIAPSQEITLDILKFIQNNSTDYDRDKQMSNRNWDSIRLLRLSDNVMQYDNELQYSYMFYQTTYVLSQNFLYGFLNNGELSACARTISKLEVVQIVRERVDMWASFCLSNIEIE